jgi:hypothetical protein
VRHATPEDLEELEKLLGRLRALGGLVEKKPGVFYRRSRAFLHFHADPSGLFADVRLGEDFDRRPVSSRADQQKLFEDVRAAVGERAHR